MLPSVSAAFVPVVINLYPTAPPLDASQGMVEIGAGPNGGAQDVNMKCSMVPSALAINPWRTRTRGEASTPNGVGNLENAPSFFPLSAEEMWLRETIAAWLRARVLL